MYTDPDKPRFYENRSPVRCARCGDVPRHRGRLTTEPLTGRTVCRAEKACLARGPDPLAM